MVSVQRLMVMSDLPSDFIHKLQRFALCLNMPVTVGNTRNRCVCFCLCFCFLSLFKGPMCFRMRNSFSLLAPLLTTLAVREPENVLINNNHEVMLVEINDKILYKIKSNGRTDSFAINHT